jgi:serine/threonine-protein kinase
MRFCPSCGTKAEDGARFCPACGGAMPHVPPSPSDPYVGRTLDGKFLIEKLLGVGGMGRVYQSRQLTLDKTVCVKVLRTGMMQDETLVRRFHREARAASRLNHPNSITVIDFGQAAEDGSLYIVMEFVPGKDLSKIIAQEFPLPEARLVHIMDQVLSALADAHAAGIVHRDLKPENIMVTDLRGTKDFVKVLDFGIAKLNEPEAQAADASLTQAGMVCGTPEYMSPEQARGEVLDARSDIYAAGIILYQCVTSRLPFTAPTAMGIVTKHLVEPPVPPSQVEGVRVSPALEAVVLKAMSKNKSGRQPTALALQQELNACLSQKVAPAQEQPAGADLFTDTGPIPRPATRQASASAPEPGPGAQETLLRPATGPALASAAPAGPRGSSLGLVVGLLIGLLVLGGGGAAAYFLYFKDRGASLPPTLDAGLVVAPEPVDAGAQDAGLAKAPEPDAAPVEPDAGQASPPAPDAGLVAVGPGETPDAGPEPDDEGPPAPQVSEAARMQFQLGKERAARKQWGKSLEAFQLALKLSPGFAEAHKALGTSLMNTGDLAGARRHFQRYLELAPDASDRDFIQSMVDSL